jgi:hypothetical protein
LLVSAHWHSARGAPVVSMLEGLIAALLSAPPAAAPAHACPDGMRLVEGRHDDQIQRLCADYRAGSCYAFYPFAVARESRVTPVRACMDVFEWPNRAGEVPLVMVRFVDAEAACASVGKRLCSEAEWETACEGPEAFPWPYGWVRDPAACNNGRPYKPVNEAKLASESREVRDAEAARVHQAAPSGAFPRCESVHGVVDLVGNVEEWVTSSRPEWPFRSALKGGYWAKPMSGCRGTNDSHGPMFRYYETGFRCCKDAAR